MTNPENKAAETSAEASAEASAEMSAEAGAPHETAGILAAEASLALSNARIEAIEALNDEWYELHLPTGRHLAIGPNHDLTKVRRLLDVLSGFDGSAEIDANAEAETGADPEAAVETAAEASPEATEAGADNTTPKP